MFDDTELTQQTDTEPTSVVNPDGTFAEDWYAKYDKADHPTLSRFNKFDDFVASHMSQRKKFGKDPDRLIEIPRDDSPDEVKAAFWKAAGEPETEEGYKFKKSPDLSEKVEVVDGQIKRFSQIAKKWHLSNAQFNGVANDYLATVGEDIDAFGNEQAEFELNANKEGNAVLNKVFRGADAASRKMRANAMLDTYGLEAINMPDGTKTTIKSMLFAENPKLLTSPWMIMLLDKVAESMSEDTIKGITLTTVPTAAQVESKIIEVRTEMAKIAKENPATFKNNPRYKELLERKHNLYKTKSA